MNILNKFQLIFVNVLITYNNYPNKTNHFLNYSFLEMVIHKYSYYKPENTKLLLYFYKDFVCV